MEYGDLLITRPIRDKWMFYIATIVGIAVFPLTLWSFIEIGSVTPSHILYLFVGFIALYIGGANLRKEHQLYTEGILAPWPGKRIETIKNLFCFNWRFYSFDEIRKVGMTKIGREKLIRIETIHSNHPVWIYGFKDLDSVYSKIIDTREKYLAEQKRIAIASKI